MRSGVAPSGDVVPVSATVVVGGVLREVQSVQVRRELATDLPGAVVGGGSIVAATGSTTLVHPDPVRWSPPNPWLGNTVWPPSVGDALTVDVTTGDLTTRQLTGRVDSASGTFTDSSVQVALVDDVDRLRRRYLHPVFAAPPGAPSPTTALAVAVDAANQAGFTSTHRTSANTVLYAPRNAGTLVPSVGTLAWTAQAGGYWDGAGGARSEAWGTGPSDNGPGPGLYQVPGAGGVGHTIDMVMDVGRHTATETENVYLYPGAANLPTVASLTVDAKAVTVFAGTTQVATFTRTNPAWTRVWVRVVTTSTTAYRVDAWAYDPASPPTGTAPIASATASGTFTNNYVGGTTPWGIKIGNPATNTGGRAAIVGLVVDVSLSSLPNSLTPAQLVTPVNLRVELSTSKPLADASPLAVVPALDRNGLDLVREVCGAVLAAVWLDETGTLQIVGRNAMDARPVVAELTSTGSLLDVGWAADLSNVRQTTRVAYRQPSIRETYTDNQTVWQAGEVTLKPGESYVEIIHPPDDAEWVGVTTTLTPEASIPQTYAASPAGSWIAKDGSTQTLNASVVQIDPRSYKVTLSAPSTNTGDVTNKISQSFYDVRWRGQPTPIIRARYLVPWRNDTATGATVGPDWAPDLEHDAGPWVQSTSQLNTPKSLADWVAAKMTTTLPRIDALAIVPDVRLQLGDKVRVRDDAGSGVVLTGVVAGLDLAVGPGTVSQSVTLRVLTITTGHATFGDFDDVWTAYAFSDFDATWSGQTFAQFDADPLRRSTAPRPLVVPSPAPELPPPDQPSGGTTGGTAPTSLADLDAAKGSTTLATADASRSGLTLAETDANTALK